MSTKYNTFQKLTNLVPKINLASKIVEKKIINCLETKLVLGTILINFEKFWTYLTIALPQSSR